MLVSELTANLQATKQTLHKLLKQSMARFLKLQKHQ